MSSLTLGGRRSRVSLPSLALTRSSYLAQMQDLEHGPTEDAVLAMVNRSAAPRAGPSAEMQDEPDVAPSQWNVSPQLQSISLRLPLTSHYLALQGWLSTHGLEAPDSKHYRRSTMLPDEPTTTGSFLSMDE